MYIRVYEMQLLMVITTCKMLEKRSYFLLHILVVHETCNNFFRILWLFADSIEKPDIFLTMTANPNWPEITEQLLWNDPVPGQPPSKQTAADRPDIVARVFEEKKKALLKEIKDGLFGKAVAMVHTIEFQKRGLPHMHLLIFLHQNDKIRNPDDVDSIVSAQIPDKT